MSAVLMAAYGTLRTDQRHTLDAGLRSFVSARLRSLGPCLIEGHLFDITQIADGVRYRYPGLIIGNGIVHGEIFAIDRDPVAVLARLDRWEDCDPDDEPGSTFRRRLLPVRCVARDTTELAWVYLYNGRVTGLRRIPGGRWRGGKD